jgi:DNA-binding NtrC family response regulator
VSIDHEAVFNGSEVMRPLASLAMRVADADTPVLIDGERGVGRERVGMVVHDLSRRATGPWVRLNCLSLPADLLEAELFGDATRPSGGPGRLEQASGGTLFLKEIGELSPNAQAQLVHFLTEKQFHRVNGRNLVHADVRIIGSAGPDLPSLVRHGRFSADLYDRLAIAVLTVPPLRTRVEEIPVLAEHFRETLCRDLGRDRDPFSPGTIELLTEYRWPGNVRELENLVKRYVVLGDEDAVCDEVRLRMRAHPAHSPAPLPGAGLHDRLPTGSLRAIARKAAAEAERAAIQQVMEHVQWNRAEAARRLGVSYKTMLKKLDQGNFGRKAARRRTS